MVRRGPNGARRNLPFLAWGIVTASVFALAGGIAESPGIREDGGASLARLARELGSHAVVLSVAMEPGQEDLATLATLGIGEGARVFSLYVTDGAATLSDFNGDSPMRLAGRRREEAYAASAQVGAEAYFLNLPDVGVIDDTVALHRYWIPDSVEAKLTRALLYCRPDMILVNRDFRGAPGTTLRQSAMLAALARAETAWTVGRVFVDRGDSTGTFHVDAGRLDPSLHKSYREIARESATTYETLRGVMGRRAGGDRVYSLVHPAGGRTPRTFLEGLPVLSPKVRDMLKAAQRAVQSAPPGCALVGIGVDRRSAVSAHPRTTVAEPCRSARMYIGEEYP